MSLRVCSHLTGCRAVVGTSVSAFEERVCGPLPAFLERARATSLMKRLAREEMPQARVTVASSPVTAPQERTPPRRVTAAVTVAAGPGTRPPWELRRGLSGGSRAPQTPGRSWSWVRPASVTPTACSPQDLWWGRPRVRCRRPHRGAHVQTALALRRRVLELSQARVGPGAGPAASWGLTFTVLLPRSQDSDLPAFLSSVHRSRRLVMPEHQSRCEFQRAGVELGLGATGEERGAEATAAWAAVAEPKDSLPCRPPASLLSSSGCRRPQQPWPAAREAGCPLGLHGMVIVLIQASQADRRPRQWSPRGYFWGGLEGVKATATPFPQEQKQKQGHVGLPQARKCSP